MATLADVLVLSCGAARGPPPMSGRAVLMLCVVRYYAVLNYNLAVLYYILAVVYCNLAVLYYNLAVLSQHTTWATLCRPMLSCDTCVAMCVLYYIIIWLCCLVLYKLVVLSCII